MQEKTPPTEETPDKNYINEDYERFLRYANARQWLFERFPHGADLDLHKIAWRISDLEDKLDLTINYIKHYDVWEKCGCPSNDACTSEIKRLRPLVEKLQENKLHNL